MNADLKEGSVVVDVPNGDIKTPSKDQKKLELKWSGVSYTIPVGKTGESRTLLDCVSGYVRQGQVVAIMGGSGAGKSTLLNCLAGRIADQKGSELKGEILVNGELRKKSTWRNLCAYVEQDDLMFTNLSVEETLTYAATLRLPSSMTKAQKQAQVNSIIMQLGLDGCRKTWIGDSMTRGISGGERKRVSIGIELVTNPSILFLDEPTSGLDASTSLNIIGMIKKMAVERGMAVMMTIHQPRAEVLDLFDKIILLSRGKTVWFGKTDAALDHFAALGYPLPPKTNPSDFFLDIITYDQRTPELKAESGARIDKFDQEWRRVSNEKQTSPQSSQMLPIEERDTWAVSWFTEFTVLFERNMKDVFRNAATIRASLGQAVFLVILMGFIFFKLPKDDSGVQSRIGL
ncbi:hypothetical protein HDU76_004694 [Blyttiomyces sp. JEL0837]|nr:hypothetical protein HDU76_004694 [Blyttiomyces sp. JEL0837]